MLCSRMLKPHHGADSVENRHGKLYQAFESGFDAMQDIYRRTLGAQVSQPEPQPAHGVTTVFITLPNTKVELLEPLGEGSPISKFLVRNPDGGIHHVCYEVDDIVAAREKLMREGARVLGDGEPKIGAHGKRVLFLHPKDFCGTLVELEEA